MNRRHMLGLIGTGAGVVLLGACSKSNDDSAVNVNSSTTIPASDATTSTTAATGGTNTTTIVEIPSETAGPYPADGTNGPNALTTDGIVRRDIRTSVGTGSATAEGIPLEIALTILDADTGRALPGAAVYLWHCDRDGEYSLYGQGVTGENYLRGVQVADASGVVRFTSIFPADYSGRWPHIHFEVFDSLSKATTGRNARKVSQLALPKETCQQVYATSGYTQSQSNLASESLSSDMVFRDDSAVHQLAVMTGSVTSGFTASLTVGV